MCLGLNLLNLCFSVAWFAASVVLFAVALIHWRRTRSCIADRFRALFGIARPNDAATRIADWVILPEGGQSGIAIAPLTPAQEERVRELIRDERRNADGEMLSAMLRHSRETAQRRRVA